MKKKIITLVFVIAMLLSALSVFTACGEDEEESESIIYTVPSDKTPDDELPEVTKPEDNDDYYIEHIEKEECEGDVFTDSVSGVSYLISEGKAIVNYNLSYTSEKEGLLKSDIVIPASVKYRGYYFEVELADNAFFDNDTIRNVIIEEGVKSIGQSAFENCDNLKSVTIPGSVEQIKDYTFRYSSIESVVIGDGVKSIGNYAFEQCRNLTDATFSDTLQEIGEKAFQESAIVNIELKSALRIGKEAFSGCQNLISIELPDNLLELGDYVFRDCVKLRFLTIPASVTTIGYRIDDGKEYGSMIFCEAAQRPEGWQQWWVSNDYQVVWNCIDNPTLEGKRFVKDGILYYTLSDNNTATVVNYDNSQPRTEINVPSQIIVDGETYDVKTIYSSAFANGKDIQKAVIGEGVRTIGSYSFYNTGLSEVVLSDSIDTIEFYAFAGTNLTQVVLPENMCYIYEGAFNIPTLESIEFTGPKTWRYMEDAQYVYIDVSDPVKNVETVQNIKRYGYISIYTGDYYL